MGTQQKHYCRQSCHSIHSKFTNTNTLSADPFSERAWDKSAKMPATPRMRKSIEKNAKNITKRGNVSKTSKKDDGYPVSTELLALFIFVVIGSAVFQIVQSIWMAGP